MPLEIERKFLLPEYPEELIRTGELIIRSEQEIDQTYLALHEDQELRVRKIRDAASGNVTFTHTFKKGFGLSREEVEVSISEGLYEQITGIHRAIPLTKRRVTAEWNGIVLEIDRYDQIDLMVLEVEFASETEAREFQPPQWFGPDISTDKRYSNKKVWRELQQSRRPQ
ncbi:CYTH domain-containing protein [Paenibacillus macerans]|uniref:CYTH domain protein n=1 Tax=Paenibacillus macerans TaxID=44252 RepID=A0A090ZND9_PAEMA|nr:CYTH domain-containing protein [Paenibacillus macerans]KFN05671.1 CYTH domain protein [Paenibacillus macerans]MBS5912775.1 CYTH domain-containing protein [Paenibacillus macerans]MCY7557924.1 CYTH domain-containing protein [Paenibacillus macerans]MDU7474122.1 CYTH domain-containing protein [Paenibacillus macerans]MEC0141430.1 CYTH domain-containing protein [Paenibacillus macerans]